MSYCTFNRISNSGNQIWSSDTLKWTLNTNIVDNIVKFSRKAMKAKNKPQDSMWIDPIYIDDKYLHWTEHFFSEVGIALYPKLTNLKEYFAEHDIKWPKNDKEWDQHRALVHNIVQQDIAKSAQNGVKPVFMRITGIRIPDKHNNDNYIEKFISVNKCKSLPIH